MHCGSLGQGTKFIHVIAGIVCTGNEWRLVWWGFLDAEILENFFTTEFWGRRLSTGLFGPVYFRRDWKLVRMIL